MKALLPISLAVCTLFAGCLPPPPPRTIVAPGYHRAYGPDYYRPYGPDYYRPGYRVTNVGPRPAPIIRHTYPGVRIAPPGVRHPVAVVRGPMPGVRAVPPGAAKPGPKGRPLRPGERPPLP